MMCKLQLKIYSILILIWVSLLFAFTACDSPEYIEEKIFEKKIQISLYGDQKDVYPWVSIIAYTENHEPLYVVQQNDTTFYKDGTYRLSKGTIINSEPITLCYKSKNQDWMYLSITYRKRMSNPSDSDILTVNLQGYTNGINTLDKMHLMYAFKLDESIEPSDYIYTIKY